MYLHLFVFHRRLLQVLVAGHWQDVLIPLALGHHQDDFNETLLMNMFIHGRIKGMQAHYVSSYNIHVIRPLVFVAEDKITEFFQKNLKVEIKEFDCPFKPKNRRMFKDLINSLKTEIPSVSRNLIVAQKNVLLSTLLAYHSVPVIEEEELGETNFNKSS
jgi:tRNA(Ile)-lysidine synthase TilS/MesJ